MPRGLRLVRTFDSEGLRLADDTSSDLLILGQSVSLDGQHCLLADFHNQRVKSVSLQTGALEELFREAEQGWCVSNMRELDVHGTRTLVVSERKQSGASRLLICLQENGRYVRNHVLDLRESTCVCIRSIH